MDPSDNRIDDSERTQWLALERVLERTPVAHVGAVRRDGMLTPLSDRLPLQPGHQPIDSRSVIDLVTTDSTAAVVSAWERVRSSARADCRARLRVDPTTDVRVEFFDVLLSLDVYLVLISPTGAEAERSDLHPNIAIPIIPRTGRVRKSAGAMVLAADSNALTMLGFELDDLVGRRSLDLIHPDDQPIAIDNWLEMLAAPEQTQRVRVRHLQGDGTFRWVEIANANRVGDDGDGEVTTEIIDVSQEMAMLERLREREQLLSRLAEALPLALLHFDLDHTIVYANERVAEITGVDGATDLRAQLERVEPGDRELLLGAADATLSTGAPTTLEVHMALEGREWVCDVRLRAIEGTAADITGAIMCISDVTESVVLRQELEDRATFDFLTGCLNRESTIDALVEKLRHPMLGIAVVYIDLEAFKSINDQHGHAMGDAVLASVGERLQQAVRTGDLVGRIGGDEFIVISSGVANREAADLIAVRVANATTHDLEAEDGIIAVKATVGVAWTQTDIGADALIARADEAMYLRKRQRHLRPVDSLEPDPTTTV